MDARSIADRSANSQERLQIATNPLAKLAILRRRTNTAGQAEIAVGVVVGEPLVSKAHQREQRGVEVHRVHPTLDGVTAEFIGGAMGVPRFQARQTCRLKLCGRNGVRHLPSLPAVTP